MAQVKATTATPVQELAESGGSELPTCYIQREDVRPFDAPPPPIPIPVVDLSRLSEPDGGGDEAAKLRSALETWGLFQAIGHEMSAPFLDEVRTIAKKFFQLPMEVKKNYSLKEGNDFMQGYGNEAVMTDSQILDWNDRLYLLVQPEDERKLELWPEDPRSFREILHEYTIKAGKITKQLLRSMAKILELNEDYFVNQFGDKSQVFARFNYYPSCSRPDLVFGLKPHSDGSAMTIVLPDKDVEGLQVFKDGEWIKVPSTPHALLINLGDQMEIMTNGIFKSPFHRVVTNRDSDRTSIVIFYALPLEEELKPADNLVAKMGPLYKSMKTKDYLGAYFQHFTQGKRGIDWAKN